jgi:hypothetical protein
LAKTTESPTAENKTEGERRFITILIFRAL